MGEALSILPFEGRWQPQADGGVIHLSTTPDQVRGGPPLPRERIW